MAVRSDRLGEVVPIAAGGYALVLLVPDGETWIVKRATLYNPNGVVVDGLFVATTPAGGTQGLWRVGVPAGGADDHETWWAFDAGCALYVYNLGGGGITALCFGAKLIGVAP